jgi:hypothetical protein
MKAVNQYLQILGKKTIHPKKLIKCFMNALEDCT